MVSQSIGGGITSWAEGPEKGLMGGDNMVSKPRRGGITSWEEGPEKGLTGGDDRATPPIRGGGYRCCRGHACLSSPVAGRVAPVSEGPAFFGDISMSTTVRLGLSLAASGVWPPVDLGEHGTSLTAFCKTPERRKNGNIVQNDVSSD